MLNHLNQVKGEYGVERKEFPAGALVIPTAQPLGGLAAYLLEPESDDRLLVWNYFDKYVVSQWGRRPLTHPVHKLHGPRPLATVGLE